MQTQCNFCTNRKIIWEKSTQGCSRIWRELLDILLEWFSAWQKFMVSNQIKQCPYQKTENI